VAAKALKAGLIIAYPTEAVWGLGCDPDNETAVHKLLKLKERDVAKGLLLVAASLAQIDSLLLTLEETERQRLRQPSPVATTWLIPDPNNDYPPWIKGRHAEVAIRISAHPLVRAICTEFGGPIVSTSANLAGEPEIRSRTGLMESFGNKIDFFAEGKLGGAAAPSQIRNLRTGERIR